MGRVGYVPTAMCRVCYVPSCPTIYLSIYLQNPFAILLNYGVKECNQFVTFESTPLRKYTCAFCNPEVKGRQSLYDTSDEAGENQLKI